MSKQVRVSDDAHVWLTSQECSSVDAVDTLLTHESVSVDKVLTLTVPGDVYNMVKLMGEEKGLTATAVVMGILGLYFTSMKNGKVKSPKGFD